MARRRSERFLTREELELWAHVTRRDLPMTSQAAEALVVSSPELMEKQPASEKLAVNDLVQKSEPFPTPQKPKSDALKNGARGPRGAAPFAAATPFNARLAKHIARGRQPINARLDLHGLRQQDAYFALRQFLSQCQASGHRHVLIITGKGDRPDGEGNRDFWSAEQRGVLRRLVPQWLSEPVFRLIVVSFTESGLRHGGSGALYVTIRRQKPTASP